MMNHLKTKCLFSLAILFIIFSGSATALAHTVSGTITCADRPNWALQGGTIQVFEVDVLPGEVYRSELLASAEISNSGTFLVTFPWTPVSGPPIPPDYESGDPDLIFLFTQNIGAIETIYEELPEEAHWNVASGTTLNFEISSDLAVWTYPGVGLSSIPNNMLFLFTRIGNCETAETNCKGSDPSSSGYYHARSDGFGGTDSDVPFGHTLDLFAWFGKQCKIDYYKVKYSTNGGATWTDIETSLPNKWYDTSDPNPLNWHWVSQSMGPFTVDGIDNLYTVPFFVKPNTPWSYLDRVARFNTTLVDNGLCHVTIEAYKMVSGSLVLATSSDISIDANYGKIALQIDNTAPIVKVLSMKKVTGSLESDIGACAIVNLTSSDILKVNLQVWDQRGHLRAYTLDAMYGHDCYVRPRPANAEDNYNNNATGSPSWQGNLSFSAEYNGSTYLSGSPSPTTNCSSLSYAQMPLNVMPSCAYQFRLHASKRTTNGYGLIYSWVEDTWHITIQR